MSLLVPCPNCGLREFTEFSFGGETNPRPKPGAPSEELADYLFVRRNASARAEGRQSRRCKHVSLLSSTSGSMIPKLEHFASVLDPVSSASASVC